MKSDRIEELDVLRAIAIYLVVLGHALCYLGQAQWVMQVIYSFHMPVLFTLSGFLAARSVPSWMKIAHSARRLLIPYVVCGAVLVPLTSALMHGMWWECFVGYWRNYFVTNRGLWYLPACFLLVCSHVVCERLLARRSEFVRLAAGFLLSIPVFVLNWCTHWAFLHSALAYWFSFHAGCVLARWPRLMSNPRGEDAAVSCVFWIALSLVFAEYPHALAGNLVKPFAGLAAILPLAYVSHRLKAIPGLAGIGESTLAVYCTEAIVGTWFFRMLSPNWGIVSAFYSLLFILAVHIARMGVVRLVTCGKEFPAALFWEEAGGGERRRPFDCTRPKVWTDWT